MNARDSFVLEITWEPPNLPPLVGPFETEDEARDWGRLNIPNGSYNVARLAYPYLVSSGER